MEGLVTVQQQARKRGTATVTAVGQPSILGENVRRIREARGLSQEELAEKSGVHRVTIARLEAGLQEGVNTANLGALADALGVQTSDLTEPVGVSSVAHLVPQLDASGLLQPPATEPERAWLLGLPAVFWVGQEPTVATLYHLIQALRSGVPRQG